MALTGPLGAGKTTLIQGLARGLDVPDEGAVTSPTFALVHQYSGRMPLVHIDAYRLSGAGDLQGIDAEDWLESRGVVAVEWADRVAEGLPATALWGHMRHHSAEERLIELMWPTPPPGLTLAALIGDASIHPRLIVADS